MPYIIRYVSRICLLICLAILCAERPAVAQDGTLTIATVTRPPFSMPDGQGGETGFSMDLFQALAEDLRRDYTVMRADSFGGMLDLVRTGQVDAAIANISITAERERVMDFSQPIFESGLQIMSSASKGGSVFTVLATRDVLIWVLAAFGLLFGGGMLMWAMERKRQPYFDRPLREAMFPSFWWALNLVVNGGFEERAPQSKGGRVFATFLVVSSLFIVSLFVAKVTAVLTVEAIQSNIQGLGDLDHQTVGTIEGSTSASYLQQFDIAYWGFDDLDQLTQAYEDGTISAVVFDAPILAHYVNSAPPGTAELAGPVFRRENYGIALPTDSTLREPINQTLLKFREDGTYRDLMTKWFGTQAN